jgi:hypothetical protein
MAKVRKIGARSVLVRREIGIIAKPAGLREYLGRFGYTVALLTVVFAWATLGAALSMVVRDNHPTIEMRGLAPVVLGPSSSKTR